MMKMFFLIIHLIFSPFIIADNIAYNHEGVVTGTPADIQEIEISNQVYRVNLKTQVHGFAKGGELGPEFNLGDKLGFNILIQDDTHYITDIWPIYDDN